MTKARTKGARKRAKARASFKSGPRHECGKLVQPTAIERATDARAVAVEARLRHFQCRIADAEDARLGYALGRLNVRYLVTTAQLQAGNRFTEDFARYYRLVGIPFPTVRAMDIFRVHGLGNDADPHDARAAANAVMRLEMVLGGADVSGRPVTSVTKRVCLQDEEVFYPHMVDFLRRGLDALARHYGIEAQEKAA